MSVNLLHRPIVDDATRRQFLTGAAAVALVAGCGRGDPAAAQAPQAGEGFPVTIDHKFGSTEIPAEPKRVACVGYVEQDALLALGIVPTATTELAGGAPGAVHPWARDALAAAPLPELLSVADGIQFERIAALEPDLILAVYGNVTEEDYGRLTQIAPTVVHSAAVESFIQLSWQDVTMAVGRAVGRPAQAAQLVADVEARLARVREEHPEFAGAVGLMATSAGGKLYGYTPPHATGRLLPSLAFKVSPEVAELAGDLFFSEISGERWTCSTLTCWSS